MVKQEKLKRILMLIKERRITAYEIAAKTSLSEVGINKILNGNSTNPHQATVDILAQYLSEHHNIEENWFDKGEGIKQSMNLPSREELEGLSSSEKHEIVSKLCAFIVYNEEEFLNDKIFYNLVERKAYELMIKMMQDNSIGE
ncbi:MAG: helix-turn-helix transcriptional regulator [Bacteroidota bacterium]